MGHDAKSNSSRTNEYSLSYIHHFHKLLEHQLDGLTTLFKDLAIPKRIVNIPNLFNQFAVQLYIYTKYTNHIFNCPNPHIALIYRYYLFKQQFINYLNDRVILSIYLLSCVPSQQVQYYKHLPNGSVRSSKLMQPVAYYSKLL